MFKYKIIIVIIITMIDNVFEPVCHPDVVIVKKSRVFVLELTVCHESNLLKSKLYKLNKYENIQQHLKPEHSHSTVELFLLEISVLGFASDLSDFCKLMKLPKLPKSVYDSIFRSALYTSHNIYCLRNTESA